jgi:hypothetical protein
VRIEAGEHAIDRSFDQFAVVRSFDVIGADALKNVAKQIQLPVGIGRRCLGRRSNQHHARLYREQS